MNFTTSYKDLFHRTSLSYRVVINIKFFLFFVCVLECLEFCSSENFIEGMINGV